MSCKMRTTDHHSTSTFVCLTLSCPWTDVDRERERELLLPSFLPSFPLLLLRLSRPKEPKDKLLALLKAFFFLSLFSSSSHRKVTQPRSGFRRGYADQPRSTVTIERIGCSWNLCRHRETHRGAIHGPPLLMVQPSLGRTTTHVPTFVEDHMRGPTTTTYYVHVHGKIEMARMGEECGNGNSGLV